MRKTWRIGNFPSAGECPTKSIPHWMPLGDGRESWGRDSCPQRVDALDVSIRANHIIAPGSFDKPETWADSGVTSLFSRSSEVQTTVPVEELWRSLVAPLLQCAAQSRCRAN